MQKIGIIGGLTWVSTAEYYRRLNQLAQARGGGVTSARIALENLNRQDYVDAVIDRQDEEAACALVREAAEALVRAGADFIVIACNDAHRFVPELAPDLPIPFLHIADVTGAAIRAAGYSSVALLGVRKTMDGDFYSGVLADHGLKTLVPDEAEKDMVHARIFDELAHDIFHDSTRVEFRDLIAAMTSRGADCVALACTELPLLLPEGTTPIPAFSTTELHCQAAIRKAMGEP